MSGVFLYGGAMNITIGQTILVNDEEVPEHILKALYVILEHRYRTADTPCIVASRISTSGINGNQPAR